MRLYRFRREATEWVEYWQSCLLGGVSFIGMSAATSSINQPNCRHNIERIEQHFCYPDCIKPDKNNKQTLKKEPSIHLVYLTF
jgi:hypothetical protein